MNTQLVKSEGEAKVDLVPADADKHHRYRLGKFEGWLKGTGRSWTNPGLKSYRDDLLADGYAPATVAAHLSTVRGRYRALLTDNDLRAALYDQAGLTLAGLGQPDGPANRKAFVDEVIERIENGIDPRRSRVVVKARQDRADSDHLRLTSEQANALLAAPGLESLKGLRDTAIIALLLTTGIREAELVGLDVADLRRRLGGELALHVRDGKGAKERLVVYGELGWVLAIVDKWLEAAGIEDGPVFRGFYKGFGKARPGRLSVRAVQYILADYPIMIDGELRTVRPHDLRRTYARRLYEAGMDLVAIQQNLGHASIKTTLGYIGTLDADKRRAPGVYSFDLGNLKNVAVQVKLEGSTDD